MGKPKKRKQGKNRKKNGKKMSQHMSSISGPTLSSNSFSDSSFSHSDSTWSETYFSDEFPTNETEERGERLEFKTRNNKKIKINFTKNKFLGKGAFGSVYEVEDENKKKYALKVENISSDNVKLKKLKKILSTLQRYSGLNYINDEINKIKDEMFILENKKAVENVTLQMLGKGYGNIKKGNTSYLLLKLEDGKELAESIEKNRNNKETTVKDLNPTEVSILSIHMLNLLKVIHDKNSIAISKDDSLAKLSKDELKRLGFEKIEYKPLKIKRKIKRNSNYKNMVKLKTNNFIHRDIKPNNIISKFTKSKNEGTEFKLSLIDYGLSGATTKNSLTDYVYSGTRYYTPIELTEQGKNHFVFNKNTDLYATLSSIKNIIEDYQELNIEKDPLTTKVLSIIKIYQKKIKDDINCDLKLDEVIKKIYLVTANDAQNKELSKFEEQNLNIIKRNLYKLKDIIEDDEIKNDICSLIGENTYNEIMRTIEEEEQEDGTIVDKSLSNVQKALMLRRLINDNEDKKLLEKFDKYIMNKKSSGITAFVDPEELQTAFNKSEIPKRINMQYELHKETSASDSTFSPSQKTGNNNQKSKRPTKKKKKGWFY